VFLANRTKTPQPLRACSPRREAVDVDSILPFYISQGLDIANAGQP
jgi:hypothetical protein